MSKSKFQKNGMTPPNKAKEELIELIEHKTLENKALHKMMLNLEKKQASATAKN